MSDRFYDAIRFVGRSAFVTSSSPVVIGTRHTARPGPFIIAANHTSPYDVPLIIRHARTRVDFVSIVEVFRNPFVAWFYGSMNAFPLDRSRPDAKTVRIILDRLERGRVVGMFPEGGFRRGAASVVHSRRIRPGIGRIATLASVPIVPCIVIGSDRYSRFSSWLPLRRVRYGIIFGEAIEPSAGPEAIERALVDRFVDLHATLQARLAPRGLT